MFTEAELADGTHAVILPLLPSDREALREGFEGLSPESRNHRFLASISHLTDAMLDHLVDEVDGIDHVALALVVFDADNAASLAMLRRLGETTATPAGIGRLDVVVELPPVDYVALGT